MIEDRLPHINSYDVLIQFLTTLAIGEGFFPKEIFFIDKKHLVFKRLIQVMEMDSKLFNQG